MPKGRLQQQLAPSIPLMLQPGFWFRMRGCSRSHCFVHLKFGILAADKSRVTLRPALVVCLAVVAVSCRKPTGWASVQHCSPVMPRAGECRYRLTVTTHFQATAGHTTAGRKELKLVLYEGGAIRLERNYSVEAGGLSSSVQWGSNDVAVSFYERRITSGRFDDLRQVMFVRFERTGDGTFIEGKAPGWVAEKEANELEGRNARHQLKLSLERTNANVKRVIERCRAVADEFGLRLKPADSVFGANELGAWEREKLLLKAVGFKEPEFLQVQVSDSGDRDLSRKIYERLRDLPASSERTVEIVILRTSNDNQPFVQMVEAIGRRHQFRAEKTCPAAYIACYKKAGVRLSPWTLFTDEYLGVILTDEGWSPAADAVESELRQTIAINTRK
jgi:hypothetical protein